MNRLHFRAALSSLVLLASIALGQKAIDRLATGSPHGIYVLTGTKIASRQNPAGTTCGYHVERRRLGAAEWEPVVDLEAPVSFDEFKQRFTDALDLIPGQDAPADSILRWTWERAMRFGRVESLHMWGNAIAVRLALGLVYLDRQPQENTDYEYAVYEFDASRQRTATLISGAVRWPMVVDFARPKLKVKQGGKKQVNTLWIAVGLRRQPNFLTFRRDDMNGEFRLIEPERIVTESKDTTFYSMRDTLVDSLHVYEYYIVPVCQYGNTSQTSDTLRIPTYSFKDVPLPDSMKVVSRDSDPGLRITWRLREPKLVKAVRLYRAEFFDGPYTQIAEMPPTQTDYNDESAEEMVRYYYRFELVGLLGEISPRTAAAFWLYKSPYPPLPVQEFTGEGLKDGVRLTWRWTGARPAGFYVYRSAGLGDTFVQVSPLIPAAETVLVFDDTAAGLSPYVYYVYLVQGMSKSHVAGAFSETLRVRPAIPTHPKEPLEVEARLRDSAVRVYWEDMRPVVKGLAGYFVHKREVPDSGQAGEFARLGDQPLEPKSNTLVDAAIQRGRRYEYAVQTLDMYGGESPLSLPVAVEWAIPEPIAPANLRAQSDSGGILIRWDETGQDELAGFRVYRIEPEPGSQSEPKPKLIATLQPDVFEYTDGNVQAGKLYYYYMTGLSRQNREGKRGEGVSIRF
jgi:hypothetical protein